MITFFFLLCYFSVYLLVEADSSGRVLPVFHNVQRMHLQGLASVVANREICSVSMRHTEALDSLHGLSALLQGSSCAVGASTVKSMQVIFLRTVRCFF
jgi:hypothetical protein